MVVLAKGETSVNLALEANLTLLTQAAKPSGVVDVGSVDDYSLLFTIKTKPIIKLWIY